MLDAFFSDFQWYRKLTGGTWIYLRIDLGERPMFWIRVNPDASISQRFAHSHTIIFTEEYK